MILRWATGLPHRISVEIEVLSEYDSFLEIELQVNDQEGSLIKKEKAKKPHVTVPCKGQSSELQQVFFCILKPACISKGMKMNPFWAFYDF